MLKGISWGPVPQICWSLIGKEEINGSTINQRSGRDTQAHRKWDTNKEKQIETERQRYREISRQKERDKEVERFTEREVKIERKRDRKKK